MDSLTARPPALHPSNSGRRGSALMITLIFTGILTGAIAMMLSSVRQATRISEDKVGFEEAYHTAISGIAMSKAWVMNPALAAQNLGTTGAKFQALTSGSIALSNYIRANRTSSIALGMDAAKVAGYYGQYDGTMTAGKEIDQGSRRVLFETISDTNPPIVMRAATRGTTTLFNTDKGRATSYVRRLRVTTPYRTAGSIVGDDLRRVSMILEAEAVAITPHGLKTRMIQEKVLIVPGIDTVSGPVVAPVPGVAFGGSGITVQGASSLNVHFAPVWAKGNVQLLQLALSTTPGTQSLSGGGGINSKFNAAGVTDSGAFEKWLKWQVGGFITDTNGLPIFRDSTAAPPTTRDAAGNWVLNSSHSKIAGVTVTDFFSQVLNKQYGSDWINPETGLNTLRLGGSYVWNSSPGQWSSSSPGTGVPLGQGILYDVNDKGQVVMGAGALSQQDPTISAKVDTMVTNDLDYVTWKTTAIERNGYVRPKGSGNNMTFVNNQGHQLYVTSSRTLTTDSTKGTKLTDIGQLSMANLIPADGNTNNGSIRDRVLFVDTLDGTPNFSSSNMATIPISNTFFWKGLVYINGNGQVGSIQSGQKVLVKNPDEFQQDPKGITTGSVKSGVYADGVVYARGNYDRGSNGILYGSLIIGGIFDGAGNPDLYYNSRNKAGLFAEERLTGSHLLKALISGPIRELTPAERAA